MLFCARALNLPCALLPELQRNKDTTRCAAIGAEVLGHRQQQLMQTLIVCLLKTHFLRRSSIAKSQHNSIKLVSIPVLYTLSRNRYSRLITNAASSLKNISKIHCQKKSISQLLTRETSLLKVKA